MGWTQRILIATAAIGLTAYLANASWLAPSPPGDRYIVAHRGLAQTYPSDGLENDTCTAARIHPPSHGYLENTLPSIAAAFDAGAAIVEIDIHPTSDGDFAVFHDWTLECRTDGVGVTRRRTMAYLRTLDAGYGYTADDGETFPFRGRGVGLIPSLADVLDAFPGRRFLINFKGGRTDEAEALSGYLQAHDADISRLLVYGAEAPVARFAQLHPDVPAGGRRAMLSCLRGYFLTGWFGRTPSACRNAIVFVPRNYAWAAWGWPRRFQQRMTAANATVILIGDWDGRRSFTTGIDDPSELETISPDFAGGIWTNRAELYAAAP